MSPRNSKSKAAKGPPPPPDVYVGLLFVAVAALTCGCVLLALELNTYGWAMPN